MMRSALVAAIFLVAALADVTPLFAMRAEDDSLTRGRLDSLADVVKSLSDEAQETKDEKKREAVWGRKKFASLGFVFQNQKPEYGSSLKSSFGLSMVSGRTLFVHKKPLWGRLKVGIDLGVDINYAKYREQSLADDDTDTYAYEDEDNDEDLDLRLGMHQVDMGFMVGPCVCYNPVGKLIVKAYFRFAPAYSMLILDDEISGSYASFFSYGGEVAWKAVGVGVEGRFGRAKYSSFISDDDVKLKCKTRSLRLYLAYHF